MKIRKKSGPACDFARLIREGLKPVNAGHLPFKKPHKRLIAPPAAPRAVYIARMSAPKSSAGRLARRLLPLAAILLVAVVAYFTVDKDALSVSLVRNLEAIDAFVAEHMVLAVLAYIATYAAAVTVSFPGAAFLTITGGFLFGLVIGACAAVIGATIGATGVFLLARTALGETLLQRAGPRAGRIAQGFRDNAFNYLLFLRLVPVFPFFLVNLVPAFTGVRLATFVGATALGIIPAAIAYAYFGTTLGSVIASQKEAYDACVAAGNGGCHVRFSSENVLRPDVVGALVALALLALVPVLVRRLKAARATP